MTNNELIPTPMMSFGASVKTCFQKYVTFKGRARRSEYWWFCLLYFFVSDSAPEENRYGKSPKYAQETF